MKWIYNIGASLRPRVLMRVILVFDQQRVSVRRCLVVENDQVLEMTITVDAEENVARRICAKLCGQEDIRCVELSSEEAMHKILI